MSDSDNKLRELQGQVLGLKSILTAIVEDNVDIMVDVAKIGRLILESEVDHADIQMRAREMMHAVLSGRDTR